MQEISKLAVVALASAALGALVVEAVNPRSPRRSRSAAQLPSPKKPGPRPMSIGKQRGTNLLEAACGLPGRFSGRIVACSCSKAWTRCRRRGAA
jgi:hypothetical protein